MVLWSAIGVLISPEIFTSLLKDFSHLSQTRFVILVILLFALMAVI